MNDLEKQLHSWALRRPSAKLEHRLFRRPRKEETAPLFRWQWLAPASVTLLLFGLFVSQHNNPVIGSASPGPIIAMILSNQSAAAYLPSSSPGEQNRLPAGYEWTLRAGATSNPDIMPLRQFSLRSGR